MSGLGFPQPREMTLPDAFTDCPLGIDTRAHIHWRAEDFVWNPVTMEAQQAQGCEKYAVVHSGRAEQITVEDPAASTVDLLQQHTGCSTEGPLQEDNPFVSSGAAESVRTRLFLTARRADICQVLVFLNLDA